MSYEQFQAKITADIERCGQSIVGVMTRPAFTYTVGNALKGLPELIIFGVDPRNATGLLNFIGDMMRKRGTAFEDGELVSLGGTFPVKMIHATGPDFRDEYTCQVGQYFEREDYDVIQVLCPDLNGKFPGDDGFDIKFDVPILRTFLH